MADSVPSAVDDNPSKGSEPRLFDCFSRGGKIWYRVWQVLGRSFPFRVRLRSGEVIALRRNSHDWGIAIEVFASELYRLPLELDLNSIRRVVDVGGNVGFTSLYWLRRLPNAHILVFEPHPVHLECFRWHMRRNGLSKRIELLPFAAGVKDSTVTLCDYGAASSHVIDRPASSGNSLDVPMVDWISHLGREPIDLLKIDIEGGEYELLADSRFSDLDIRNIVIEWHKLPNDGRGGNWCIERLESMGFQMRKCSASADGDVGMIWALKPE